MKRKIVGVQRELNEIAEELVRQGFEVTETLDSNKQIDALVYYGEQNNMLNQTVIDKAYDRDNKVKKINASENTIDDIVKKINEI